MSRAPEPALRRAVLAAKFAIVAAMAFFAVSSASAAATTAGPTEGVTAAQEVSAPAAGQARLDKLVNLHDCSAAGFGADVIPGSSLVLQDDKVRHVSFDDGWAIYTGEKPGTLLALCRVAV